ncbi:MAG: hypothetical protein KatS3mg096_370 [Candidatus Parcubacteria bacterium]|nr:MAG: hypothetical protein KatS3mg096_370 [Candidatus Parcubacteria bacterium]
MFEKVLDKKRKKLLPLFSFLKKDFYLAGGTGLSLILGHRKSYDFDFFSEKKFDERNLFEKILSLAKNHKVIKSLSDKSSLFLVFDNEVNVNFLFYKYPLIKPLIKTKFLNIASLEDILCMKLLVVTERIEFKDYVDLYYGLKKVKLKQIVNLFNKKISDVDINFIFKELLDFSEIEEEPIDFMPSKRVDLSTIKNFLIKEIRKIYL